MVRGSVKVPIAIALLLLMAPMSGCLDVDGNGDGPEDKWTRPEEVELQWFFYNRTTQAFELEMRLMDAEHDLTKWDGEVRTILYDADLEVAYDQTMLVSVEDFVTEEVKGLLDSFDEHRLDISIGRGEVEGDPHVIENASWQWDAEVWFTFAFTTLKSERANWYPPDIGYVERADIVYWEDEITVRFILARELDFFFPYASTKAAGVLHLELTDRLGDTMYEGTHVVKPGDFGVEQAGILPIGYTISNTLAYLELSIPFSELSKSRDRNGSYDDSATMNLTFAFEYEGVMLGTGGQPPIQLNIPESLILPNKPPIAVIECPDWCWENEEVIFVTTGTHDPDGEIHDAVIVVDAPPEYYQSFDRPTEDGPIFLVKFFEPGVYNVTLKVQDSEFEWANATTSIKVKNNMKVEAVRTGVATNHEVYNYTFVLIRVINQAPYHVYMGSRPSIFALNETGYHFKPDFTSSDQFPTSLGPDEVIEVTLYFKYLPYGSMEPVPFVPVTLEVGEDLELDLSGLWAG